MDATKTMDLSDHLKCIIDSLKPEYTTQSETDLMAQCATLCIQANRTNDPMESICCLIKAETINEVLEEAQGGN